jgi:nitrous oxidase accessory protein
MERPATITLFAVALLCLGASWGMPWWEMQARAPQYGQRTLLVEVNPRGVTGDTFEVDSLGHYVGIRKMETFAPVERKLAPVGFIAALLALLALPFLRRRWQRALAAAPVILLPVVFCIDLDFTMARAANDRDPEAALNLIFNHIDTKLFGEYVVAQFKLTNQPGVGLWLAAIGALLTVGLALSAPLPLPFLKRLVPAAALLLLLPLPAKAGALQDAIDRAAPGDTIHVTGFHRERIAVRTRVRIVGDPGAVLDGGGEGTVIRVTASGASIEDLAIRGSGDVYSSEDAAVRVEGASNVTLRTLVISDALFGVFAAQADGCHFEGLSISGKDVPADRRGDGIRLWYSSGCVLKGNLVENSRDLVIWYSNGTLAEDNVVRRSRYGLHYMYSDHNTFRRNRFEDDEVGAAIMYSKDITLEDNAFSFSSGPSADGLLVKDADDVFIRGNRFVQNSIALFFDGAPQSRGGRVEVSGNLIGQNDVGVALQPSSRGIDFTGNSFAGNHVQVQVQGGGSAEGSNWSGNWWSDALVYDRDGDGVSELPYSAESTYEALADRHPELRFYAGSPAADAIDLAARLFPLFRPRPLLTDPRPLARAPLTGWTSSSGERDAFGLWVAGAGLLGISALIAGASKAVLS